MKKYFYRLLLTRTGLLILSIVSILPFSAAYSMSKEEYIEKMKSNMAALDEKIKSNPTGKDYFMRASTKMMLDQNQEAESDFVSAEAMHYNEMPCEFNNMRGANYLALKDIASAITYFNKVLKIKPNDMMALTNRGNAYCQLHRYTEALADSVKAIKLDSRRCVAYETAGECYLRNGQYQYAIQYFDQSIARESKNFEVFHLRAEAYQKLGKKNLAARDFATASSLGYAPGKIFKSTISP